MRFPFRVLLLLLPLAWACSNEPTFVDTSCVRDADCVVKDARNCCGYFPQCVNVGWTPDPDAVRDWCEATGTSSSCGFTEYDGCVCVEGTCQGTVDGARVD